jgi:hypothetical protein
MADNLLYIKVNARTILPTDQALARPVYIYIYIYIYARYVQMPFQNHVLAFREAQVVLILQNLEIYCFSPSHRFIIHTACSGVREYNET